MVVKTGALDSGGEEAVTMVVVVEVRTHRGGEGQWSW